MGEESRFPFEECLIVRLTSPQAGPPHSCLWGKAGFGGLHNDILHIGP